MEYKIEYRRTKIKPGGYIGMNAQAARELHVPFHHKHPAHVIEVYGKVPKKVREHTIRHEEDEEYEMRRHHHHYHTAHKLALKFEKREMPFPKKNIKRMLKGGRK